MKFLKQGVSLALLGAGLAAVPLSTALTATPASAAPDKPSAVQRMKDTADGTLRTSADTATGKLSFARATGAGADLMPGTPATTASAAADKAADYLDSFGAAFGAAAGQLHQTKVTTSNVGWTVSYEQRYQGLPVFGSGLKAHVDKGGDLTAVTGFAVPDISVSTTPRISESDAAARAVRFVKGDPATSEDGGKPADTTGVKAATSTLSVYRTGFLRGESGATVLAWAVEVTNRANVRDMVILDAATGKIVNRYSIGTDALDRELREAGGTKTAPTFRTVYTEGQDISALNTDQQNLVNSSGESYWMYENAFGYDSYDNAGAKRITVNNDPRIDCPNANWNGVTTNYCDGVTSDDVVAHEWGHAYTEYTSGLIYQYQPGALNESYSDVWGETLDQINGREDEGEVFGTKRPDGECDPTAAPKLELSITAPAAVAGPCSSAAAAFGPAITTAPITATVAVATDAADAAGPTTTDGCSTLTNSAALAGKWAYVDRGTCAFQLKIDNATAAGAKGIIFGNNAPGVPPSVAGTGTIYGIAVSQADGTRFKSAGAPVTISVAAEDTSTRTDSTRWLIGEKSEAFGGAIRDMWTPTCYGNPGKVTDAEYNCDPLLTDSGGVHGNSGVPNHLYALAVDGGTSNGQTVVGMGLDKAANIWWHAQTDYLVPASDFTDAADAFEASCTDLTGQPINKLSTTPNAGATPLGSTITADDCANLTKAIAAVEMRSPVTQCDFQPILQPGSPTSACGAAFNTRTLFTEDFEDGLAGWAPTSELGDGGGTSYPWEASTSAPEHTGGVAFGPDPDDGDCAGDGSDTDISSSNAITSGSITVPTGDYVSPRLTFDHYVATEAGYDGGNVKLSINGGAFAAVPAAAYTFNAPKTLATVAGGNTSPLAGQPGFTGTDGGTVKGSWGTSQIDLGKLGVQPGSRVRIRLDMGRDGCGGLDGWYVDNITVTACQRIVGTATATLTATTQPSSVEQGKAARVVATVEGPSSTSPVATGLVTVSEGSTVLGTADVAAGTATVTLPTTLSVGTHQLTVGYSGDARYAVARTRASVVVTAAPVPPTPPTTPPVPPTVPAPPVPTAVVSTTKAEGPDAVRKGATFKATVKVKSASAAAGKVKIKVGGKVVGKGKIVDGKLKVTVKTGSLKLGKTTFKVVFAGSTTVAPSKDRFTVRITR